MTELQLKYWREFHTLNRNPLWRLDKSYHGVTNVDMLLGDSDIYEVTPNMWHEEGSVYTHTAMVYDHAMRLAPTNDALLLSALAHDIGKPFLREHSIKKDGEHKVSFVGHDFCSALMCIKWMRTHFCDDTVMVILKAIALHTTMYKVEDISSYIEDHRVYELLKKLAHADVAGRYSSDESNRNPIYNEVYPLVPFVNKPWVTIMIGMPGSGKSTIAPKYGKVFSADDYMENYARTELGITGNYDACFKACCNAKVNWKESAILSMLDHVNSTGEDVVFDATNGVKKKRVGLVNRLKKSFNVRYVLMWRDLEDCMKSRQFLKDKHVPLSAYKQLLKAFTYPSVEEGYNSIDHILV